MLYNNIIFINDELEEKLRNPLFSSQKNIQFVRPPGVHLFTRRMKGVFMFIGAWTKHNVPNQPSYSWELLFERSWHVVNLKGGESWF